MKINTIAFMFIGIAVTIPRYIVIERLGLIDNFLVHIVPGLAVPVGLFWLSNSLIKFRMNLSKRQKWMGQEVYDLLESHSTPHSACDCNHRDSNLPKRLEQLRYLSYVY